MGGPEKTSTGCSLLFVDPSSESLGVTTTGQKEENNRWGVGQPQLIHIKCNFYTQDSRNITEDGAEMLQEPQVSDAK